MLESHERFPLSAATTFSGKYKKGVVGVASESIETEVRPRTEFRRWPYTCLRGFIVARECFQPGQNFPSDPHAYPRESSDAVGYQMQMRMQWPCMHVYVCYRRPDFGRLPAPVLYIRAVERIIYDPASEYARDRRDDVCTQLRYSPSRCRASSKRRNSLSGILRPPCRAV